MLWSETKERKPSMRCPKKLIKSDEDVALHTGKPSPAQMVPVLSHGLLLFTGARTGCWETKLMLRMQFRGDAQLST